MWIEAKFITSKYKLNVFQTFRVPDNPEFNLSDFIKQWMDHKNKTRREKSVNELNFVKAYQSKKDPHHFTDYTDFMRCDRCGLRYEFDHKLKLFSPDKENEIFKGTGCIS